MFSTLIGFLVVAGSYLQPIGIAYASTSPLVSDEALQMAPVSTSTVSLLIDHYSAEYGLSPEEADLFRKVGWCESRFKSEAVGDRGTSFGVYQIHLPAHPDISKEQALDPRFNIRWAAEQFAAGRESMWSCARIVS